MYTPGAVERRVDELLAAHGAVPPPWAVFDDHPYDIGWRMGEGEFHMYVWHRWWGRAGLSEGQRIEYLRRWPPPGRWLAFVITSLWGVDTLEDDEDPAPYFARLEALGFGGFAEFQADFHDPKWLAR